MFQVVAERAEQAAIVITTNLPFSEWTQVFTNARLCKALLDRLTDRAHIIETGSESYRFRRTLETRRTPLPDRVPAKLVTKKGEGTDGPEDESGWETMTQSVTDRGEAKQH